MGLRWPIGPKVDIFALGCVIYAAIAGVHPFPLDGPLANLQARYQIPDEALSAYCPQLLQLLRSLLAREPAGRSSAASFSNEVCSLERMMRHRTSATDLA